MHNTEIRIARIFNNSILRMQENDGRVVSTLGSYFRAQPLTLYGGGTNSLFFCYVDDLIEGLIRLMEGDHTDL